MYPLHFHLKSFLASQIAKLQSLCAVKEHRHHMRITFPSQPWAAIDPSPIFTCSFHRGSIYTDYDPSRQGFNPALPLPVCHVVLVQDKEERIHPILAPTCPPIIRAMVLPDHEQWFPRWIGYAFELCYPRLIEYRQSSCHLLFLKTVIPNSFLGASSCGFSRSSGATLFSSPVEYLEGGFVYNFIIYTL